MNKKQKTVMWIGIAVFLWIGFNPRWTTTYTYRIRQKTPMELHQDELLMKEMDPNRNSRLRGLFAEPTVKEQIPHTHFYWGIKKPASTFCYWLMVAITTGGLIYTFRDKKPQDEQKQ